MKKFLLFCLIPALLLCGCQKKAATPQTTAPAAVEPQEVDEIQLLQSMAKEVALAYAYGNFSDVQDYMLFTPEEQTQQLFPGQSAPYQYSSYTFASWDALEESIRSLMIAGENPSFSATVINTTLEMFPVPVESPDFMKIPEASLYDMETLATGQGAMVTVTMAIDGGEEPTGTIDVFFLHVEGQWKVCSPTVSGYFAALYYPADIAGTN